MKSGLEILGAVCIKSDPSQCLTNLPNNDPSKSLPGILGTVYWVAGIVAVLTIVIAGIFYITSAGNPQQAAQARTAIIASVIGLVVVVSAFAITQFVLGGF